MESVCWYVPIAILGEVLKHLLCIFLVLSLCSCRLRTNIGSVQSKDQQAIAIAVYGGQDFIHSGLRSRFGSSFQDMGAALSIGYSGVVPKPEKMPWKAELEDLIVVGHIGITPLNIANVDGRSKMALFSPWTEMGLGWQVEVKKIPLRPYLSLDAEYNNWGDDDSELYWGLRFGIMVEQE